MNAEETVPRFGEPRVISPLDGFHRVHNYYKGSPYHPDGRRVLCFRFLSLESGGHVCVIDRDTGEETELAPAETHSYHTGANAYFCDKGRKAIFRESAGVTAVCDVETRDIVRFEGTHCNYAGNILDRFIEVDSGYPHEEQGKMGIYVRNIDGAGKRLLANVHQLLDAHPLGKAIRHAEILFRLGGEISPDQRRVRLGLLTRRGGFVKDFFTCNLDGDPELEFHGKLGSHPGWQSNSRDIFALVKPWATNLGELREYFGKGAKGFGLLGRYNTRTHEMGIASDFRIPGGSHIAPSPAGRLIVMDCLREDRVSVLIYDESAGATREVYSEDWDRPEHEHRKKLIRAGDPTEKRYDISAHPVFSRDGRRIVFNSCADGTIRLKEFEVLD